MIHYKGFSKLKDKELTLICTDDNERDVIKAMYELFEPDTMIQCLEPKSNYLYEELPLSDLYKKPDKL
jgi:hypothetical protein